MDDYKESEVETWEGQTYYQELHFLLGKIVVNYNMIESRFILLICNLSDPKDITVGFRRCKGMGAAELLELVTTLIQEKVEAQDLFDEFNSIHGELKIIIAERNKYIHSIYLNSQKLQSNLTPDIEFVERMRVRELQKGTKSKETEKIHSLVPLRALVQWINHIFVLLDRFVNNLSRDLTIFQVEYAVNNDSTIPKE